MTKRHPPRTRPRRRPLAAVGLLALLAGPAQGGCLVDFGTGGGPTCGNGVVDAEEQCDDGDALSGDGCDDHCLLEDGWACTGQPSDCTPLCGDDEALGDELCDGEDLAGATCQALGFYEGSLGCGGDCRSYDTTGCSGACGDGALSGPEPCDGTRLGGDSCESLGFYPGTLACLGDCTGYDTSGCGGRCGDGVVNGGETCDGSALPASRCSDYGAFYGGAVTCRADCTGVDTSGCWTSPRVVINELGLGRPDWVELRNLSEVPVELEGWSLEWHHLGNTGADESGTFVLPAYPLDTGARVVLVEGTGGGDPVVGTGVITYGDNIAWSFYPGSAVLFDEAGVARDFVRWGSDVMQVPPSISWTDDVPFLPAPGSADTLVSLSRVPDGVDTDQASDWCVAAITEGTANVSPCQAVSPPSTLLITEVQLGQFNNDNRIELYNPGAAPVDLAGWGLIVRTGVLAPSLLPTHVLAPGQHVSVIDDAGAQQPYVDGSGVVHIADLGNWGALQRFAALLDPVGYACVDFVRWGGATVPPPAPDTWFDSPAPLPSVATDESIGRVGLTDTDTAADWCAQLPTHGAPNGQCLATP